MGKYSSYFQAHFRGLRLLVEGEDPHRGRPVKIYAIPGDFSIVGVTDTIDAWIAPTTVAPSPLFDKVRKALYALQRGEPVPNAVEEAAAPVRRRLTALSAPQTDTPTQDTPRRRVTVTGRAVDDVGALLTTCNQQSLSLRRR